MNSGSSGVTSNCSDFCFDGLNLAYVAMEGIAPVFTDVVQASKLKRREREFGRWPMRRCTTLVPLRWKALAKRFVMISVPTLAVLQISLFNLLFCFVFNSCFFSSSSSRSSAASSTAYRARVSDVNTEAIQDPGKFASSAHHHCFFLFLG